MYLFVFYALLAGAFAGLAMRIFFQKKEDDKYDLLFYLTIGTAGGFIGFLLAFLIEIFKGEPLEPLAYFGFGFIYAIPFIHRMRHV